MTCTEKHTVVSRLRAGSVTGLAIALVYSGYVLVLDVLSGGRAFADVGVGVRVIVPFYVAGGLAGGLVYGLLKPLTRSRVGAGFVGFVIALLLCIGSAFLLPDADLGEVGTWVIIVLAALFFGVLGGLYVFDPPVT